MTKAFFFIFLFFKFISFGQSEYIEANKLQLDKSSYFVGDTIRVDFNLESLMILYSNFGGCGNGPYFLMTCHSDSSQTQFSEPICDLLIEEFTYIKQGHFYLKPESLGVFSITVYVKNDNVLEIINENIFIQKITTEKFEVFLNK